MKGPIRNVIAEGTRVVVAVLLLSALQAQAGLPAVALDNHAEDVVSAGIQSVIVKPPAVVPANQRPLGYSLWDMALTTAHFFTGDRCTPPETPFKILVFCGKPPYNFEVKEGTMFYVPVFSLDDSPPVIGTFPEVKDKLDLNSYVYSMNQVGIVYGMISVDGWHYLLNKNHLTGVDVWPPLPDGGGTRYAVVAAFLKPLGLGLHTIEISAMMAGKDIKPYCEINPNMHCKDEFDFKITYYVNVVQ
ncbi:MAG: hypothetical protein ACKN9W_08955 [Methylococcus sp.]